MTETVKIHDFNFYLLSLIDSPLNGPTNEQPSVPPVPPPVANIQPAQTVTKQRASTGGSTSAQVYSSNTGSGNVVHLPMENGLDYRHGGPGSGPSSQQIQQQQQQTSSAIR